MPDTNQPTYEEDEITLKEVILKIQEFILEAWRHKWWIVAAGLGFAAIFLVRAMLEKPTYTATLTFMVNEDEGGSMGGIATILGQFGLSSGSRSGRFNMEKIMALARSRRIVQEVLFEQADLNGKHDYIANHIIDFYDYHQAWEKDTLLSGFYFRNDSITLFKEIERKALLAIYGRMVGNPQKEVEGLMDIGYNEETGILSLNVKSYEEVLSIIIANKAYEKLSRYYIEKTTEQQQKTYNTLKFKVDSIQTALYQKEQQLAQFQDQSQSLLLRTDNIKQTRLNREVQMLTLMYGEAIKNLETASFLLKSSTPVFQVVDPPISPIDPVRESKLKALVLGGFLGGFVALFILLGGKIVRDTIAGTKE